MLLSLQNASFHQAGKPIFTDFSFGIREHEHTVLRGANGAGKTLLLECLAGLRSLSAGTITYGFVDGSSWDERHRQKKANIRYVPSRLFTDIFQPHRHELYYQQRYHATCTTDVLTVADYLRQDGDPDLADLPPNLNLEELLPLAVTSLSNGQLRKLILLKALQHRPALLLLDYPYEGLDVASRDEFNHFLDHLLDHYPATLLLTDNRHELPSRITRSLTLPGGLEEQGKRNPEPPAAPSLTAATNRSGEAIALRDIQLQYGDRVILASFSWTVRQGERWALVGKNGSGKSTLLSMLFGDNPRAYSSQVSLFGHRRGSGESIWDLKKRINFIAPEIATYFQHSVSTGLAVTAYVLTDVADAYAAPRPPDGALQERCRALLAYFAITHLADRRVGTLSSGEMQLVLLVKAFLRPKELYLLDEPFQFLDARRTELALRFVQQQLPETATLILITHYPDLLPGFIQEVKYLK